MRKREKAARCPTVLAQFTRTRAFVILVLLENCFDSVSESVLCNDFVKRFEQSKTIMKPKVGQQHIERIYVKVVSATKS